MQQRLQDAVRNLEIEMIDDALRQELGNVAATARRLGLHITSLLRKLNRYKIVPSDYSDVGACLFAALTGNLKKWIAAGGTPEGFAAYMDSAWESPEPVAEFEVPANVKDYPTAAAATLPIRNLEKDEEIVK